MNYEKEYIKLADAVTGVADIVSFIERLVSIINITNKPGNRVLDVDNTEVVLENNLIITTRNAEREEDKQTGSSRLQHYFMEVLELAGRASRASFEIRNSITFESLKECYSFVTVLQFCNFTILPGDERYFKIAQAYKIEKNVIIKFHALKFYNELVNELLEKTHIYPNPFLYVHKNIMNAAERKMLAKFRKKCANYTVVRK